MKKGVPTVILTLYCYFSGFWSNLNFVAKVAYKTIPQDTGVAAVALGGPPGKKDRVSLRGCFSVAGSV